MNCPMCEGPLAERYTYGIGIIRCDSCRGIWFESGAVKPFLDTMVARKKDIVPARLRLRGRDPNAADRLPVNYACPSCGGRMVEFIYAYDSDIYVPKCNDCGGVWADLMAIEKLLAFTKGTVIRPVYTDP